MKNLILLILVIATSACNKKVSSQNKSSSSNYQAVAYEALGITPVAFQENETNEYVLATFQEEGTVPGPQPLKYVVIKIADNSIVKKESIPQGSVKWTSDYQVEIIAPPGMIKNNNETIADYTYLFNVKTGVKVRKTKATY